MREGEQMSLDDLLARQRQRDGWKIVARVVIGNRAYEKDFEWSGRRGTMWNMANYRMFFPADINGGTRNLPIAEYEQWADYEFEYFAGDPNYRA